MTLILAANGSRIMCEGNTATGWEGKASVSSFLPTTELITTASI